MFTSEEASYAEAKYPALILIQIVVVISFALYYGVPTFEYFHSHCKHFSWKEDPTHSLPLWLFALQLHPDTLFVFITFDFRELYAI